MFSAKLDFFELETAQLDLTFPSMACVREQGMQTELPAEGGMQLTKQEVNGRARGVGLGPAAPAPSTTEHGSRGHCRLWCWGHRHQEAWG